MPIYEYKCRECGSQLEAMQKISDEPLKECPKCSGMLEKQWSRSGFQFKGTGWYVTDYAAKGGESKSEGQTESKSETGEAAKTSGNDSTAGGEAASKPETKTASTDSGSTS